VRWLAIALALSLVVAAWHDVSKAWDTWAYHLPYAARFVGLVGPDTYTFSALSQPRYEGFPLFCEALQGLFWRLTGRPECANFVALLSLFGLCAFVRRVFDIPAHVAFVAYLAIPLVQIHATQCYVDLPANVALTILLLVAHRAWSGTASFADVILAAAMAIASANSKFQLMPLVLAGYIALAVAVRRVKKQLLFLAVALPLVFATPLANLARHGNPAWPVEVRVLGHDLPSNEKTYDSAPYWLEHAPRSARFAVSVLEIGVDRWSVDQWTPPGHPGKRMGGFFGAYVIAALAAIGLAVWKKRARITGAFVAGATVLASVMLVNNEIGVIQDIKAIGEICRPRGVLFHVDAAQATGKVAIDTRQLNVDLMSLTAHKTYGPKGIGALYVARDRRVRLEPQMHGGGHELGMRSGTLATHQIVGMGECLRIAGTEMATEMPRVRGMRDKLYQRLAARKEVQVNGDMQNRIAGNLNFSLKLPNCDQMIASLTDIAVSSTSACSSGGASVSHVLQALGNDTQLAGNSIRITVGRFNTDEEINFAADYLVQKIVECRAALERQPA
jgi:hypothetical protein